MEKNYDKIVLAYSGGLDTSVLIPWLKENYGAEIIAVSVDVGQGSELDGLEEKALASGAKKLYIEDLKNEFVEDFIFPAVQAGADYENYLLGTSLARPLIAKRLVEIARDEGAQAIVHGCTGKGNDQVRFELTINALAPDLDIIAPWRFWELDSRQKEIEYARAHNVPLKIDEKTNYSKDKNLWHLSHEGLDLEDPANEAPYNREGFLELGQSMENAPDTPETISIKFEQGIPVALNDEKLDGVTMIERLNDLGGKHGIGLLDLIENRLVGMKSRGVYEAPAATILYAAHKKLEELTLDRQTRHYKDQIGSKYGELVYDGLWYTPLRKALQAFVDESQKPVTGEVVVKLYKGNIIPLSVTSPYSLYNNAMATFDEDEVYDQADSAGFIHLFGLPLKIRALNDIDLQKSTNGEDAFPDLMEK